MMRFAPLVLLAALAAGPARAQAPEPAAPPDPAPSVRKGAPKVDLDRLFGLLKRAPDAAAAKFVEMRIAAQLAHSGSDTADLLMTRARAALEAKDYGLVVELLDHVVEIKPDFAEAYHRRATARFLEKDYGGALADLAAALRHEPRHFGALVGIGMILMEIDRPKPALEAFRQAQAIHPHLERVPDLIKQLEPKVDGRPI